jgi:hypothetical protein
VIGGLTWRWQVVWRMRFPKVQVLIVGAACRADPLAAETPLALVTFSCGLWTMIGRQACMSRAVLGLADIPRLKNAG